MCWCTFAINQTLEMWNWAVTVPCLLHLWLCGSSLSVSHCVCENPSAYVIRLDCHRKWTWCTCVMADTSSLCSLHWKIFLKILKVNRDHGVSDDDEMRRLRNHASQFFPRVALIRLEWRCCLCATRVEFAIWVWRSEHWFQICTQHFT